MASQTVKKVQRLLSLAGPLVLLLGAVSISISSSLIRNRPESSPTKQELNHEQLALKINPTPCRFALESHLRPLQVEWFDNKEPILQGFITVGKVHHILFVTKHIPEQNGQYADAVWTCSSNERGNVNATDAHRHTLIVQCQSPIITTLSVRLPSNKTVNYNTLELSKCEQEIHVNERPTNATIGACTAVKGEENRGLILQWVEYHRLIGVDHFWVYINENISKWESLPRRPYLTYVPFAYDVGGDFFFQQAVQNECLYRSRAYGLYWLGMHDVDEYFHVTLPLTDPNSSRPDLIRLVESIHDREVIGGLQFFNWWYGRQPGANASSLLLDYVGRAPHVLTNGQEKLLIRPPNVDYFSVHRIATGQPTVILNSTFQGYHNHYRYADRGVQSTQAQDVVIDTSLRDAYRTRLLQAILEDSHRMS